MEMHVRREKSPSCMCTGKCCAFLLILVHCKPEEMFSRRDTLKLKPFQRSLALPLVPHRDKKEAMKQSRERSL